MMTEYSFEALCSDCLEKISCFLDTKSALALYRTSKTINNKLIPCTGFWKSLCKNQNFQDYAALKSNQEEEIIPKLAWSGDRLHDIEIPQDAVIWRKIFMRGIQMRRNICSGRYELWRLFMTDEESLPVKQMKRETTFQELMSSHRKLIPFNDPNSRVNNDFDDLCGFKWNENFIITIQGGRDFHDNSILVSNDIFVWSWNDSQNPKFLYSFDIFPLYPTGLFDTTFFVHNNHLVLMPETLFVEGATPTRSMIRVHDLDNNMALVGSYDFPLDGYRRYNHSEMESALLCEVGGKAVALCRTPNFMFFIFSLPTCELVQQVCLPANPQDPLELDELDHEVHKTDTTLMFSFYDPTFFDPFGQPLQKKYGRLLVVDFKQFLEAKQPIKQRLVNRFECNEDLILQSNLIKEDKLVCLFKSRRVEVRHIVATSDSSASFVERLSIPCPEPLLPDIDRDCPAVCTSRTGDLILVKRHFVSGRKIHAYSGEGSLRYMIDIDAPEFGLERRNWHVAIGMNANFVCAADPEKVVIWNNNTGKIVTTIEIPKHYNSWEEPQEEQEWGVWRPHEALDFQEDRIIIVHNGRNFPAAADILRFW